MNSSTLPMSRVRIFLAIGILGAVVLLALRLRDSGSSPVKTEEAIRKVLDNQAEGWNQGDLDGYMAGYSQSDELTFYGGADVTHGKANVTERYRFKYKTTHHELGLGYVLGQSLSARQTAACGVPLGVLPQEVVAVYTMPMVSYEPEMGQLHFDDVDITLIDATRAIVRGRWNLTFKKKPPAGGLFTLLFRKEGNQWWIIHDHSS